MSYILGIDLGTTNSAMAVVKNGKAEILENAEGGRTTPSMVALTKLGERLAGLLAKRQAVTNPQHTLFSVKRLIGRRFTDPEVQHDKPLLPYEIREEKNGGLAIRLGDLWHTPQEISAMVLSKLKQDAQARLGEKITDAIITVPAYFDDSQRKATKEAGEIAGFSVRRIINEPTAAALAYGLEKKKNEHIVVYDFGGGTFDVSVLEISQDTVEVKATGGDTHLGGDDLDTKIVSHIIAEFKKQEGADLSSDRLALQRLREAAERAKLELSSTVESELNLPFITSDASGPKHLVMKLTRAKLEDIAQPFIVQAEKIVERVVKDAGYAMSDIHEVVMVGGQTRMPAIQASVGRLFGKEPHRGINPDEVVAVGAAVQGGILQGDVKDVLLLDVTPLTLGIETLGGVMTPLVEKNTTIPVGRTQTFSTAAENQTSVEVHALQGERPMAQDNKSLGRFILDGIAPAPRGIPQVEVTFDIDANGILSVKAKDKATGKEQSIRIEASTGLSKEEVERMRQDAEAHAEEDRKRKELADLKNQAEQSIWAAEKALKDFGEKISAEQRKAIEDKIDDLKRGKEGSDSALIRRSLEALSQAVQQIGQALYGQHGQGGSASSSPPPPDDSGPKGPHGDASSEGDVAEN